MLPGGGGIGRGQTGMVMERMPHGMIGDLQVRTTGGASLGFFVLGLGNPRIVWRPDDHLWLFVKGLVTRNKKAPELKICCFFVVAFQSPGCIQLPAKFGWNFDSNQKMSRTRTNHYLRWAISPAYMCKTHFERKHRRWIGKICRGHVRSKT